MGQNKRPQVHISSANYYYGTNKIEALQLSDCRSHYFVVKPSFTLPDEIANDGIEFQYSFQNKLSPHSEFKKTKTLGQSKVDLQTPWSYKPCEGQAFESSPHFDDLR